MAAYRHHVAALGKGLRPRGPRERAPSPRLARIAARAGAAAEEGALDTGSRSTMLWNVLAQAERLDAAVALVVERSIQTR